MRPGRAGGKTGDLVLAPDAKGVLDLSGYEAEVLPEWVSQTRGIRVLRVPRGLRRLPASPDDLRSVFELDLRGARLGFMPGWATRTPRLLLTGQLLARHRDVLKSSQLVGLTLGPGDESLDLRRSFAASRALEQLTLTGLASTAIAPILADVALAQSIPGKTARTSNSRDVWDRGLLALRLERCPGRFSRSFPSTMYRLYRLLALHIIGHEETRLPDWLSAMPYLTDLILSEGQLEEVQPWLGDLQRLVRLNLNDNNLSTLPASLARLSRLEELWCSDNPLTELPMELGGLTRLAFLDLNQTRLAAFPTWAFDLPRLRKMRVRTSPSESGHTRRGGWTLPRSILDAPRLEALRVDPGDYSTPPPEVIRHGLSALRDYWSQRALEGTDYLCEAKLLIIGEAGAGKTTLSRKLRRPDAPLAGPEETTEGIDVATWGVQATIRAGGEAPGETLDRWLDINIWDFGGQEIYHATHQFFLTRRSVYVLVADCRKEDTDFHYWLRAVELFGGDSPVLIALNRREGRIRTIDLDGLRGRFRNLLGAWVVDLSDNRGLADFTRVVQRTLSGLPHLGEPLPASWRKVRDALDGRRRAGADHIGLDRYLAICAEHGFTDRAAKLHLAQYLHDIGACLHFQDHDLLRKTVIVDPEWGTDAVYKVLDHRPIIDARGRFTRADLAEVWADARYEGMHAELRALMERFQLIYPLPDGHAFIAPQLLHPSKPAHDWPAGPTQTLRYDYAFMPRGIVNRFIVATHDLIADQRLVWRSGVVLARGDARCEVVEDHPGRTVTVRVTGPDRRALLAIVDRELEKIHQSFPRLDYRTLVPCACRRCQRLDGPCLYDYEVLRRCARMGQKKQCDVSFEMVDPLALLDAAVPDRGDRGHFDRRPVGELADMLDALRAHDLRDFDPSQPPPREAPAGVYVSYAWASAPSAGLVERLTAALGAHDIPLIRDRDALGYKASISGFMDELAAGRCVVVLLSPEYLRSLHCMRELIALAGHTDWRARIFPVLLDPALLRARARLAAIKHWEDEIAALDAGMKAVEASDLHGIREEIDDCRRIRAALGRLTQLVNDLNLRPGVGFEDVDGLVGRIRAQIG